MTRSVCSSTPSPHPPPPGCQCAAAASTGSTMMRPALLVLVLTAVSNGILPEIPDSGINHILEFPPEVDSILVEVEQLPQDPQPKPEDAFPQTNDSVNNLHNIKQNETVSGKVIRSDSVHSTAEQETVNSEQGNSIDNGCVTDDDCGKGKYCLQATHNSRCKLCKETDLSCTKDVQCCGDQLCVWGQCSQNATKGEAGSTCQNQKDCSPDLCCAFHKTLLFPVCMAKPIERESCFSASNHVMELLSWDTLDEGPRKNCPCAGDLHCQHLGRGSMCLKGEDSSEEDLTESLYSEIDYVL